MVSSNLYISYNDSLTEQGMCQCLTHYGGFPQSGKSRTAVIMAWPHEGTEWVPNLHAVQHVTIDIARQITRFERLLMVAPDIEDAMRSMSEAGLALDRVRFYEIDTNDTWARDFGPIPVFEGEKPVILDFGFNGWGLRFPSDLDNQITRKLGNSGAFGKTPTETMGFILEGGSIESDGRGTILTTSSCLLSPNRNPHLSRAASRHFCVKHSEPSGSLDRKRLPGRG